MRLCKCGAVVADRCLACYPMKHSKTTKERGYGNDHREASERYRVERPLCEVCNYNGRTRASKALHHIEKIVNARHKRMERDNWLAVCGDCHELVENNIELARKVKAWSDEWDGWKGVSYER